MNNYLNKISYKKNEKNLLILFFCLFLSILAIKYLAIHLSFFLGDLPLAIDEAQYFAWSKDLNFGYFSKPPFIAWILKANSVLFGENPHIYIRNLQPLAFAISTIFVSLSSFEITKKKYPAILTGFLFFLLPLSSFYSQFATTDAWLLGFWSVSLYFFIKATITNQKIYWILCGITVGLGLLSKYSMVFFIFSALIYLILHKKLFKINPWLSFLVSMLVFSPNIVWNIQQRFPTFIHHAEMTNVNNRLLLSFQPVMEFFLGQFVVFGPLLFLLFLLLSFRIFFTAKFLKIHSSGSLFQIPIIFSWTILIFVLSLSFFGETEINWAAPASIGICIAITSIFHQSELKFSNRLKIAINCLFTISLVIHLIFLLCFISGPKLFKTYNKQNDPNINPFLQVSGYQNLVNIVLKKTKEKKNFLVISEDRGILANMSIVFPSDKIRSWKKTSHIRHHWDLTQPLMQKDLKFEALLIIKVNSLSLEHISNVTNDLTSYFMDVRKVSDPELDKIILQGKNNQKVMLFWINENKRDYNL